MNSACRMACRRMCSKLCRRAPGQGGVNLGGVPPLTPALSPDGERGRGDRALCGVLIGELGIWAEMKGPAFGRGTGHEPLGAR